MFVELVDQLRCPALHEETWLVLAAEDMRDRHVITGFLGCPVCNARYPVRQGTVCFAPERVSNQAAVASPTTPDDTGHADWPLRLAAFLGLGDARGVVGLYGTWASHAEALGDVVEGIEIVAIAPAAETHPMLSTIVPPSRMAIPLAAGALRAVAVDASGSVPGDVAEAARLVRNGGRILAPATAAIPHGVHELARDTAWWIGERDAAPAGVISIASRRR